jgi:hypothetical protein
MARVYMLGRCENWGLGYFGLNNEAHQNYDSHYLR